jgi:hypothetical protein
MSSGLMTCGNKRPFVDETGGLFVTTDLQNARRRRNQRKSDWIANKQRIVLYMGQKIPLPTDSCIGCGNWYCIGNELLSASTLLKALPS